MICAISRHGDPLAITSAQNTDAVTVYLGNALCQRHLRDARAFVGRSASPMNMDSSTILYILESEAYKTTLDR